MCVRVRYIGNSKSGGQARPHHADLAPDGCDAAWAPGGANSRAIPVEQVRVPALQRGRGAAAALTKLFLVLSTIIVVFVDLLWATEYMDLGA